MFSTKTNGTDGPLQSEIARALGVRASIEVVEEIESRVAFLAAYVCGAGSRALVLGISGGIDSTTAGRLARLAIDRLRGDGYDARFIAVRLPYRRQRDEPDAQAALEFVSPDERFVVDIQAASDALMDTMRDSGLRFVDESQRDMAFGNVKARQRMVAQYAIAYARSGLVVGTDHAAEAVMGFYTKHGDGACDVAPLAGLTKRQVKDIAKALGAPSRLVEKTPTADLEELRPQRPDEEAFGVTYDQIDDFLEGKPVLPQATRIILQRYAATVHKRSLPVTLSSHGPQSV